jgi:hypothetical protein
MGRGATEPRNGKRLGNKANPRSDRRATAVEETDGVSTADADAAGLPSRVGGGVNGFHLLWSGQQFPHAALPSVFHRISFPLQPGSLFFLPSGS